MTDWNPFEERDNGLPPADMQVVALHADPQAPSERRVRVELQVTPFEQRPNLEVEVTKDGRQVSSIHIIEAIDTRMAFTMHIRGTEPAEGQYLLTVTLSYPEIGTVNQKTLTFEIQKETQ